MPTAKPLTCGSLAAVAGARWVESMLFGTAPWDPVVLGASAVVMLAVTGGRERTAEEYRKLYAQAGFELTRVVPTASAASIVEGRPAA